MSDDKISVRLTDAKVKVDLRSKDRMKITIKLNKEEATSFLNMKKSLVPEDVDIDVFCKTVFFMGIEQFHHNTMNLMQKYVRENEQKLRDEGVEVDSILTAFSDTENKDPQ